MATFSRYVEINGCEVMTLIEYQYDISNRGYVEITAITGPSGEDLMAHFSREDLGELEEEVLKENSCNDDFDFREPEYTSQDWSDFADICEP